MTNPNLHPHRAANLAENPYAGQGPVLLDIGDDIGAIVLHLTAALEGAEIEIEPANHQDDHGTLHHRQGHDHDYDHDHDLDRRHIHRLHVAVVGRPLPGGLAYTAVFPHLPAGQYRLIIPDREGRLLVQVRGGEVTEVNPPP
jgi:hypothetical protein